VEHSALGELHDFVLQQTVGPGIGVLGFDQHRQRVVQQDQRADRRGLADDALVTGVHQHRRIVVSVQHVHGHAADGFRAGLNVMLLHKSQN